MLPSHGWGSLTYLKMSEGASLNVTGTLSVGKTDEIVIPKNSTVTVGSLVVDDNTRGIVLEDGAKLIVRNATTIKAKSTLHVKGEFSTKSLTNNSGNLISSGTGATEIEGNLQLNGSASLDFSDASKIISGGSLTTSGAGLMKFTGSSKISVAGDMNVSQGSKYNFGDHSEMTAGGNLITSGDAFLTFSSTAKGRVDKAISLKLGAILTLNEKTFFSTGGNVSLFDGAKINVSGVSEAVIGGDVNMENGNITTSGNATIYIDKKLTAYRDNQVSAKDQSGIYICDYANSTQATSKFIHVQPASYYGPGCNRLPVTWLEVKVRPAGVDSNTITWTTAKEWDNCHFEVERSVDHGKHFVKIGKVQGAGWTNNFSAYQFTDDHLPSLQGNIYYRLKQVDYSGFSDYSDVIKIERSKQAETTLQWKAYPNPVIGNQIRISCSESGMSNQDVSLRLLSPHYLSEAVKATYGERLDAEASRLIEKAPKGIVIIEVVWKDKVNHLKLLKN